MSGVILLLGYLLFLLALSLGAGIAYVALAIVRAGLEESRWGTVAVLLFLTWGLYLRLPL